MTTNHLKAREELTLEISWLSNKQRAYFNRILRDQNYEKSQVFLEKENGTAHISWQIMN